jgi:hypothetical protein
MATTIRSFIREVDGTTACPHGVRIAPQTSPNAEEVGRRWLVRGGQYFRGAVHPLWRSGGSHLLGRVPGGVKVRPRTGRHAAGEVGAANLKVAVQVC